MGGSALSSASAAPRVAPILGMHLPLTSYLDAHDLAVLFKVSPVTILRRAKSRRTLCRRLRISARTFPFAGAARMFFPG